MIVARNIRISDLLRVLNTYNLSDYVNVGIIIGINNTSDQIKISKSSYTDDLAKNKYPQYRKFELKNLNDYI